MNEETKALMAILIREIQERISKHEDKYKTKEQLILEINKLLDGWITANDLHPEKCKMGDGLCFIAKDKV